MALQASTAAKEGIKPPARLSNVVMTTEEIEQAANLSDVVQRFCRYVQIDSQSDPLNSEETPSNPQEFDMAHLLAHELRVLGAEDVSVDAHSYVTASIPASAGAEKLPALALISHMDSTPDAPGVGVKPQIVHYEGGNLEIGYNKGKLVYVSPKNVSDLEDFKGQDIVTSDGTTLLSADDKAGVAEIMALVARVAEDPTIAHPTLKIAFVPDEELGHGAALLDLENFGATWGYTIDGEAVGELNYECFNACDVAINIEGIVVHPGFAKDKMVNALSVWREFDDMIPTNERPEDTDGYEGYYHCYRLKGKPDFAHANYILRDFDAKNFEARKEFLQNAAAKINDAYGYEVMTVRIKEDYRNMAEKLKGMEFLVDEVVASFEANGVKPLVRPCRGGTDGAQLTFRGLPCPNIGTGACECHSVREFVPVPSLEKNVEVLQDLVVRFAKPHEVA